LSSYSVTSSPLFFDWTLKMKTICSFEMSVTLQRSIPCDKQRDLNLQQHRCENLKSGTIILVNNKLDALFSVYLFISLLYMFRETQCSSSGESNCINTSFGICHSVEVTAWYAGHDRHSRQSPTKSDIYKMMY